MNWLAKLVKALGGMFPSCKEAARLQSDALDRSLPFRERFGLRLHLLICKWCRRYGRQIAFLRTAARSHHEDAQTAPAQGLSREARQRIKERLRTDAK